MSYFDQIETAAGDVLAALDEQLTDRRADALKALQTHLERANSNFNNMVALLGQLQNGFEEIARYHVNDLNSFHAVFRTDQALSDRILESLVPERKSLSDAAAPARKPLDLIALESLQRVAKMVKYTGYGSKAVGYSLMVGATLDGFARSRLASATVAQTTARVVEIEMVTLGASRAALVQNAVPTGLQAAGDARYMKFLQFAEKVGHVATVLSALVSVMVAINSTINIARMREAMTDLDKKVQEIKDGVPALQSCLDGYAANIADICAPFLSQDDEGLSCLGKGQDKVDFPAFLANLGQLPGLILDDDDGVGFMAKSAEVARQAGLVRRIMAAIYLQSITQTSRFDNDLQAAIRGARLGLTDAQLAVILGDSQLVAAIRDFAAATADGTRAVIQVSDANRFAVIPA